MKHIHLLYPAFFLLVSFGNYNFAQSNDDPCSATPLTVNPTCVNISASNAGATDSGVPNPGCAFYSGADVWFSVTVPASGNITVSTSNNGGFGDGGMAIYSGSCVSPTLIQCDDDGGVGLFESIFLSGQTPGAVLLVRVWEFGGGAGGTFDICASDPIVPSNISCDVPDPICSGSPIVFTAQSNGTEADIVNPGNNYDCLFTSPNPSWYYLEIATGGNLDIDITAGSDIDFAIWGPYSDLATAVATCDAHGVPLDCSYSVAAIEQANVVGVVAGEVYVLLVTNYANTVQTITVDEASTNSASTDCSIVPLPVALVNFQGAVQNESVLLSWSTVSERDNDFFAVEHSTDGLHWSTFDLIQGAGNSNIQQNYTAIDAKPKNTVMYYRLKQFDFNGAVTISETISVLRNGTNSVTIAPNPAHHNVQITADAAIQSIELISASGTISKTISAQNEKLINVDLSEISNGVYIARILTQNEIVTKRLVVTHE